MAHDEPSSGDLRSALQAELIREFAKQIKDTSLPPSVIEEIDELVASGKITVEGILQATKPAEEDDDGSRTS